jgi:hypothetical protein
MTPIDFVLAAAGRSHVVISQGGRKSTLAMVIVVALFALTIVPILVIGLTPIPQEISLADLRDGNYPSRTSWLRLEGDLSEAGTTNDGYLAYRLQAVDDEALAVTIRATAPLATGRQQVTGQPLGGIRLPGTFDTFYADVPPEPARHDPWLLIAIPSVLAVFLLLGERVGYPVMRAEVARGSNARPLISGELVRARWNGQIRGHSVPGGSVQPCTVAVEGDPVAATVTIADAHGAHTVVVLRTEPKVTGRVCRIGGCRPGIEFHGPGSDVVLEFDSTGDRDRVAFALGRRPTSMSRAPL